MIAAKSIGSCLLECGTRCPYEDMSALLRHRRRRGDEAGAGYGGNLRYDRRDSISYPCVLHCDSPPGRPPSNAIKEADKERSGV